MNEDSLGLWESLHAGGRMPDDTWPPEDMIRQISRLGFARSIRSSVKCLDVGCGSGPMTYYLAKSGYDVSALDQSESAVRSCSRRLRNEGLAAAVERGDVRNLPYAPETFDFCLECQLLVCLPWSGARETIREINRVTRKGGFFLSRTPSEACWGFGLGTSAGRHEWRDASEGPFAGMGLARFVSRDEITELYSPFSVISVEHTQTTIDNGAHAIALWIVICKKEEAL